MTEEKNRKSESKEQPEKERRFDPELLKKGLQCDLDQYDRLIKCSKKGPEGIKEWNEWRRENLDEEIWLQGADFRGAYMKGTAYGGASQVIILKAAAHLLGAVVEGVHLEEADLRSAHLEGAQLWCAHLERANLRDAHLEGAQLYFAHLEGAELGEAHLERALLMFAYMKGTRLIQVHLERADLNNAHLEGADLGSAHLRGANLRYVHLEEADIRWAHLEGADLYGTHLEGADLCGIHLQGAELAAAIVNGSTSFLDCEIDKDTDFRETALENMRIESGKKTLLKYNIRRMNWEDWYAEHRFLQWPVKLFWSISDYGISTLRIIACFFGLAIAFAIVYLLWPSCVMVNGVVGDIRGFVHALYFSVVTMTTLGFGDIAANPDSWPGQFLLLVQVILGYVLLGALVTRLAVLFTSDGPAGSYTPMGKETKELLAKLKEE